MQWIARKEQLKNTATLLWNVLFPPSCVLCQCSVDASASVCHDCFSQLHFISTPHCSKCGHPFTYDHGTDLCMTCQEWLPPYDVARAALRYDEQSRCLVTRFKFSDATHLADYLGQILRPHAAPLIEQADIVIPVPLHPHRLRWRRYNQSALLARAISPEARKKTATNLLRRIKNTTPQTTLDTQARQENVADVFDVPKHLRAVIKDKRIVLVDDVITTGATIHACTQTLKDCGASWVGVITLAKRVIDDEL